jgi:hypothetical protein
MSNRAIWDIRKRHVWLAKTIKGKPMKRRERVRVGLQQALDRKQAATPEPVPQEES